MNELFDFGSRPIRAIEEQNKFLFVHDKEGWTIAETRQAFDNRMDEVFDVWDAEGKFMGTIVDVGNLATLVSQIYDQQYATPIKPEYVWVVFAELSDGENTANFSRESIAPDLETAKERFLSASTQGADFPPNEITIITVYGPYMLIGDIK